MHLDGTQSTDATLIQISRLTSLKDLVLSKTEMTDAGLAHLKGLTRLEWFDLNYTQVTDAGFAKLKLLLPSLQDVIHSSRNKNLPTTSFSSSLQTQLQLNPHDAASCRCATRPVLRTRPGHPKSSVPIIN